MTCLRIALQERNESLFKEVEHQVEKATPQLWHTYGTFPSGTKHTPEHTQMVEDIAGWLLPDDLLRELSDDEIAFLILACHYHDLGMAGTEEDNLTAESRDRVRDEHAVSIGDRILEHWQELGFPNETTPEILAEICKGHRPKKCNGVATWNDLPKDRIVGPDRYVRVRLVSAMVYAADELHIGEDRAPKRDEEFNRIVSPESRQHWRRHQAVQGPALLGGELCFDGSVGSPAFEKNLRTTLHKAFQAVNELTEQLKASGIEARPAAIRFRWNRKKTWELLIAITCGDLIPRTAKEIASAVEALHTQQMDGAEDVSALCIEAVTGESLQAEIQATISNFITREFLARPENDAVYTLDGKPRTTEYLFGIAQHTDELDSLFMERDHPQHEYQLYQSEFGRRYIREQLYPRLQKDYLIDVAALSDALHLKNTIESSPTTSRITQAIKPPPSVLVQTDLLGFASIAGTCADLINDPELILDADYRHAVTQLFEAGTERLPKFLLFIEELAIIKKLTFQQILDAASPSAEALATLRDDSGESFQVTQTFPTSRPDWSLGYLMLASQRAEMSIAIQNSETTPFQFEGPDLRNNEINGDIEGPIAMTIGPGQPMRPKTFSYRASIHFNPDKKELLVDALNLSADDTGRPLLFQISQKGTANVGNCKISFVDTELSVGDIGTFRAANSVHMKGGLTTIVKIDGKPSTPTDEINIPEMGMVFYDELVERLATLGQSIPYPLYAQKNHIERLTNCDNDVESIQNEIDSIVAEIEPNRPTLTSIFLRFSSIDSQDYYEEYLGLQKPGFGFNAPIITGDSISQDEIDEKWRSGDLDYRLGISLREDAYESAQILRDWVEEPTTPFPFQLGKDDLKYHYAKTRITITFDKVVDRLWYLERRVIFRFRPVSKAERYGIEMNYWKTEGDDRRACLLNELFQTAAAEEAQSDACAPDGMGEA